VFEHSSVVFFLVCLCLCDPTTKRVDYIRIVSEVGHSFPCRSFLLYGEIPIRYILFCTPPLFLGEEEHLPNCEQFVSNYIASQCSVGGFRSGLTPRKKFSEDIAVDGGYTSLQDIGFFKFLFEELDAVFDPVVVSALGVDREPSVFN
jgi:hypothetical protein